MSPPEQRIILNGISWETYERLLAEHPESAGPRFTYDNGRLELMVLSLEHEEPNRTLATLFEQIAVELGINFRRVGSNTFKCEDLKKGFEPNSAFYIQNAARVKGKTRIDLRVNPAPDLVIEIDVTNSSLPRFPIFASVGVAEVWRYDGERVRFFGLQGETYSQIDNSAACPLLTPAVATHFLRANQELDSTAWTLAVREWAHGRLKSG